MGEADSESPPSAAMGRRGFLKTTIAAFSALLAAAIGWPLVQSLIGPMYRKARAGFVRVGAVDTIPEGTPVKLAFTATQQEGYIAEAELHSVWVVKRSASDLTVFSPICTHLGCGFNWFPRARQFVCPCHGSVFAVTGEVLAGPAPRLDTLPFRVEDGQLLVLWEQFEPGISVKVSM